MKITFDCIVTKGVSEKTKKTYYKLEIVEIGKTIFLSDTEAKLLSMLHPYTPDSKKSEVTE